jgi:hypothetical protein
MRGMIYIHDGRDLQLLKGGWSANDCEIDRYAIANSENLKMCGFIFDRMKPAFLSRKPSIDGMINDENA